MASKDKPYRVYRGGRAKGPIAPHPPLERAPVALEEDGRYVPPGVEPAPPRRRRRRLVLWIGLGLLVLILVFVGWGLAGYFSLRHGVEQANERLPEGVAGALTPQNGSILSSPTYTLLVGVDRGPGREGPGRADALVLVRTDPDHHRLALLSIPRDLRVEIPGHGFDKVNAAYALGGPGLAINTVESLTGLPVNHVAIVDFSTFDDVVDALGGVTIDVPKPLVSNRFDCPYKTRAACEHWPGWRFKAGEQTMDGQRALVYSRIRENQLDPSENDLTRGGRQQQVIQAIADEVVGVSGYLRMPFIGDDVMKPIATDLSTTQLLQLWWVKFRASSDATLRCRLGGIPEEIDGVSYLSGTEENVSVIGMVTGETAPQPPLPGEGPFAPGCTGGS